MRKTMNMCLGIALCLCLAACGNSIPDQSESPNSSRASEIDSIDPPSIEPLESAGRDSAEPSGSDLSENPELMPSVTTKSDGLVLEEPPKLVVSTMNNTDSVIASCGNYQWNKEMPDGTTRNTIACGAHPLDEVNERATLYTAFPAGSLPTLPDGQMPRAIYPVFYLNFGEIPPETVTVYRWPSIYIGHASEYASDGEDVTVDISDGFTILPTGDGEFVYEVHADWGEVGHADYVFNTVPQVKGAN